MARHSGPGPAGFFLCLASTSSGWLYSSQGQHKMPRQCQVPRPAARLMQRQEIPPAQSKPLIGYAEILCSSLANHWALISQVQAPVLPRAPVRFIQDSPVTTPSIPLGWCMMGVLGDLSAQGLILQRLLKENTGSSISEENCSSNRDLLRFESEMLPYFDYSVISMWHYFKVTELISKWGPAGGSRSLEEDLWRW